MNNSETAVSLATFHRMPLYLAALRTMRQEQKEYASSVAIAEATFVNASVVKKDLSYVTQEDGKPKLGYVVVDLIDNIEEFLGYKNTKDAVLIGAGKLGQALMGYSGFESYGLNIVAGFDVDEKVVGTEVAGKKILHIGKLKDVIEKLDTKIAILTIPQKNAQIIADTLVEDGIRAIWNFTPSQIVVPDTVAVRNENMASGLAILSSQLKEILKKEDK